ncbi:MAG TPA: Calx-beta domain-containing protein, partial [Humisphaera sp.]
TLTVTNSTFTANTAVGGTGANNGKGLGGAIFVRNGTATVTHATVSANTAAEGGRGIYVFGDATRAILTLRYSILGQADNSVTDLVPDGLFSVAVARVMIRNNPTVLTNVSSADPLLGALGDNGGPTRTLAPLPGSPAIDAASGSTAVLTDQRGIARPQSAVPDIGAVESRGFGIAVTGGNGQSAQVNTGFASPLGVRVSSAFGEPVAGGKVTYTPPASGASAALAASTVTLDGTGSGSVTATAGAATGSYAVTATAAGVASPASFNLTNLAPAAVSNVTSTTANGAYGSGSVITITVAFDAAVTVTGTPTLALNSGGTANYSSGSGTSTLTFTYVPSVGHNSADLDYTSTSALSLNGGTISSSGTPAVLTLPAPGSAGSLGANKNIVVDTIRPALVNITHSPATGTVGSPVTFTVSFDEPVSNASAADFDSTGTAPVTIGTVLGNGTNQLLVPVTPTGLGTIVLRVPAGATITDAAGNAVSVPQTDDETVNVPEAGGLIVTTASDASTPFDGLTSLREAIAFAKANPGDDTVTFDPAAFPAGAVTTITLGGTELLVDDTAAGLTIQGPGADRVAVSGGGVSRVFRKTGTRLLTIDGLAVRDGQADGGGGIRATAPLTLRRVGVTGNVATGGTAGELDGGGGVFVVGGAGGFRVEDSTVAGNENRGGTRSGGGIYTEMPLTLLRSVVTGNTASLTGGGVQTRAATTIVACTISGNTATRGAGIDATGPTLRVDRTTVSGNTGTSSDSGAAGMVLFLVSDAVVTNSTFSGNRSVGGGSAGGAIALGAATLTMRNVTVTGNSAGLGGGIGLINSGVASSLRLANSIVAGNTATSTADGAAATADLQFAVTSSGGNVIGVADLPGGAGLVASDLRGTAASPLDAQLAPLANNGGPTMTHALLAGSPAINAGLNANVPADDLDADADLNVTEPVPFDQRGTGFNRVVGGTVDAGAVEAPDAPPYVTTPIADVDTVEDAAPVVVALRDAFADVADGSAGLAYTVTGNTNPSLFAAASIDSATDVLTLTLAADANGFSDVTITATDTAGQSVTDTFRVTVAAVNDPPTFTKGADQTVAEDAGPQTVTGWAPVMSPGPADEAAQAVSFVVTGNTNPALFAAGPAVAADGTLTYTPAPDANGKATITLVAKDAGGTANGGNDTSGGQTFTITVTPVTDVSVGDVTLAEGSGGGVTAFRFPVTRDDPTGTTTVDFATLDGTAGVFGDYTPAAGSVAFADGETIKYVTVYVAADNNIEPDQDFFVTLSNPSAGASIKRAAGRGLILNDDLGRPALSVSDAAVAEGNSGTKYVTFTVTLDRPTDQLVTVKYATASASAVAGSDFVAAAGTLSFGPRQTTAKVTVAVKGDTRFEADETFRLNLSSPTSAAFADAQGVATILNDDGRPNVSIANAPSVVEGNSGTRTMTFTVRLSNASDEVVTVKYATADGTAKAALNDYKAKSGTLTFAPGETVKTIAVTVVGDTRKGPDETVFVNLSSPTNASLLVAQAVGKILNDD